jgi:D-xylose 1-dehydrogenase (NADP+, D-xylono-1,5-lactone-forming)
VISPVRWGFLGAGHIASKGLAPAVHSADGTVLVAAAARDETRAKALGPSGGVYGCYDDVLADPAVEVVYIALPNDAHLAWARRALAAGKHVLCEKPLGMDALQVRELSELAVVADRLLAEAVWNRWHPRTRRAVALILGGVIGQVRHVAAGFSFGGVPDSDYRLNLAQGGGALYDVGCYAVTAALWATDFAPLTSCSATRRLHPAGVDLVTDAQLGLRLSSGTASAEIHACIDGPESQWLRISGDEGVLEFVGGDAFTSWRAPSILTVTGSDGAREEEHFPPVDPYRLMVEQVSRAVREQPGAWLPPLGESLRVAEAMDAIRMTPA